MQKLNTEAPKQASAGINQTLLVLTTLPDHQQAIALAEQLVRENLAACVNVLPQMISIYEWKGALQHGQEHLLIAKTTAHRYNAIETHIQTHHPYELPEIVATPISCGLEAYLSWIIEQTDDK